MGTTNPSPLDGPPSEPTPTSNHDPDRATPPPQSQIERLLSSPTPSLSPLPSDSPPPASPLPSDASYAASQTSNYSFTAQDLAAPSESDGRPSALLAPVRGLRALARVCAGGGAVAYASARRRRRLDGDPDVDGELGGSRGRDSAGWRSARQQEGGGGGHHVQVLVGGRASPALSYGSAEGSVEGWRRSAEFVRTAGTEWEGSEGPRRRTRSREEIRGIRNEESRGVGSEGHDLSACTSAVSSTPTSPASTAAGAGRGFKWPWTTTPGHVQLAVGVERPNRPFAAEVAIKGWQVVGGRSFDDRAKVGAYVVYEIEIALRNGTTVSILRRYTEFVRLREALRRAYPHLRRTIPALPGKNHMHKFSPEFLEDRRPRLQRFLRTVMLHPEMGVGAADSVLGQWVLGSGTGAPAPRNGARLGKFGLGLPSLGRGEGKGSGNGNGDGNGGGHGVRT